ncbi:phosphatase PAP2 family protein [Cellulomonas sp. McL0617]|uniref:phosphatase PAP2 family protein n=1 Tax=Cellulomonas sp. McL0617 TaxID=3415675 RepID=UPI003CE6DEC4
MPYVRRWPVLSCSLLAAALLLGFVAADTHVLQPHGLAIDEAIASGWRSPVLTAVMLAVSTLASPVAGVLYLVVWTVVLLARRRPVAAVSTFLVVAVGWNSALVVKAIVGRARPPADLVHALAPETGPTSYPSGHTALAVSLAAAAWFLARGTRWSRLVAWCGVAFIALVGFSRLYVGAHYPGDIVGSVLVSTSAIVALTGLWHIVLRPRLGSIPLISPLLARFGPLAPVGATPS